MNKYSVMVRKTIAAVTGLCLWFLLSAFCYKEAGHDLGSRASKILDFKCTLINCLQKLDILTINVGK